MKVTENKTKSVVLDKKDLDDLDYVLSIVYVNQNSHGDKELDAQSVRAYKLLNKLFKINGWAV